MQMTCCWFLYQVALIIITLRSIHDDEVYSRTQCSLSSTWQGSKSTTVKASREADISASSRIVKLLYGVILVFFLQQGHLEVVA